MPSGLSQSHQEIAGQFQRELLQLICLGSGGQHVQRPLPRGMGRPIGLQCPCNSFTRQEVRGASDSTNQRIENNALVPLVSNTGSPGVRARPFALQWASPRYDAPRASLCLKGLTANAAALFCASQGRAHLPQAGRGLRRFLTGKNPTAKTRNAAKFGHDAS